MTWYTSTPSRTGRFTFAATRRLSSTLVTPIAARRTRPNRASSSAIHFAWSIGIANPIP